MRGGLFIVFEGIDGSGKSSCMDAVALQLGKDMDVIKTAEPTKGPIGTLLKTSSDLTPEAEAMLFTADRAQHTVEIERWLDEGKTVLCDRYYASTLAYQSAKLYERSLDRKWLWALNRRVTIEPDITFLFDIDPEISMGRIESRGSMSKFERLDYLKRVREKYRKIAIKNGFVIIDASRPEYEVLATVLRHISKIIKQYSK